MEGQNQLLVSDFTSQQPFDEIFKNKNVPFTYVIHTASPLKFNINNIQEEMIEPAVKGAVSVLNSFEDITREGRPYNENDWNPVTAQQAMDRKDTVLGYNVSKTQSEKAAWEFMKTNRPNFDLTVINPDIIIGPMIHPISGPSSINETNHFAIASFIDGTHSAVEDVRFPFYHFVDVRDVAQSHVDALTNPAAGGRRILLISGLITPQLVVNIIRQNFPSLRDRVPEGNSSQILPNGVHPTGWDMQVSLDILSKGREGGHWKYIPLEQSVTDAVQSMIDQNVL
ncbi:putative uncharacterized oxidoreductase C513.07 [Aspergillus lentulus]|uniref:putative oxidoreductase C513.07 n=1 Tax=Aspergillus lentulus TaxID=293939 RepID=UPI0013940CAB|nr:putative uncharacterized oxidoreductase C513.07 [Aspergillus lentulus]GFF25942.1 putative uncharacterized oxidoreductase C513.07 [Aspergillus lentulus]